MIRNERGFTLVELSVVVLIISIVAALAQPRYNHMRTRARAAQAVSELDNLRSAVLRFQGLNHTRPPEATVGIIPAGLQAQLQEGYSFTRSGYTLDYDNWGGVPFKVGVTIVTTDTDLGAMLMQIVGSMWQSGDRYSMVIE
ncbi:MAG: prepilin-type N-terminal cleavage/methylation domain-containing protein [Gemmatimonadetes bacterium]|nr:prepilin-type N-terminal cleavage/methylation domain-containing protein [Gemmatimonadota bacterium]